jgi:hypothetical protein
MAEIGHLLIQNKATVNGTIPRQTGWTRLRPQCRAQRSRRGALPLPPSGVLNYDGLSSPSWGRFFWAEKTRRYRSNIALSAGEPCAGADRPGQCSPRIPDSPAAFLDS